LLRGKLGLLEELADSGVGPTNSLLSPAIFVPPASRE
jgi:hypothetical protein